MKVVTWNCNGALRKKHHAIDRIGADLIIVQECEDPERSTEAYRDKRAIVGEDLITWDKS